MPTTATRGRPVAPASGTDAFFRSVEGGRFDNVGFLKEVERRVRGLMQAMVDSAGVRRIGTPDNIAVAAEFLLGPAAAFITGAGLLVDGGVTAAIRTGTLELARFISG